MKSPPVQMRDSQAYERVERFIEGIEDRAVPMASSRAPAAGE